MRYVLLAALLAASPTSAMDLNGWCIANDEPGCMEGPEPFRDGTFATCEANCQLSNPTEVRDMDATLFDVQCASDGPDMTYRVFIAMHGDYGTMVDQWGASRLERCE